MLVLLLGRQRTGTGALGGILHRHPELYYTGEILHPDDAKNALNFFNFIAGAPERAMRFALPGARLALIQDYLGQIQAQVGPRSPVLDVKYSSLHHWNLGWQGLFDRPWVITYARQQGIPILHLRRRNHVATFVSGRLAELNKVWHTRDAAALRVHSMTVPVKELRGFINNSAREAALLVEWLRGHNRVLTLDYEDILDAGGDMPEPVAAELAAFLNIAPFATRACGLVKQAPASLADSIQNYAEVAESLRDTEFAWMIKNHNPSS